MKVETQNENLENADLINIKSNGGNLIFKTINSIMKDLPAIGKDSKNTQQNFWFRGIDAVMNGLNPMFAKHGLFVVPNVLEQRREEKATKSGGLLTYSIITVAYTFYATDGSSIVATVIGEAMDSADKATNKAMSIAFKYACFQVFCIPTEEVVDPDGSSPDPASKGQKATKPTSPKPTTPEEIADEETLGLRKSVIELATKLGGKTNEEVMKMTVDTIGSKNPNNCSDKVKLNTLIDSLNKLSTAEIKEDK